MLSELMYKIYNLNNFLTNLKYRQNFLFPSGSHSNKKFLINYIWYELLKYCWTKVWNLTKIRGKNQLILKLINS